MLQVKGNDIVTLNPNKYGKPTTQSPDNFVSLTKRAEIAMNEARKSADKVNELVNQIGYGELVEFTLPINADSLPIADESNKGLMSVKQVEKLNKVSKTGGNAPAWR